MFEVSKKLNNIISCPDYKLINEKPIETLSLSSADILFKSCVFLDDSKYVDTIGSNVEMVITNNHISEKLCKDEKGVIVTDNPRIMFFLLHNSMKNDEDYKRIEFNTIINGNAQISSLAHISNKNVVIEEGVVIEPFATIYANVLIKKGSIIRSGTRIGGAGYEFKRFENSILSVEHLGGVEIGENVEIQNNSCVDRGIYPWDNTTIGDYCKIDNLVHVAHGCKIGSNCLIVANSGIGGRTIIKPNAWIGFGSTVVNGTVVGENSRVNMGSVVTKKVKDNESVTGNFAIEHSKFISNLKKMSL